MLMYIGCVFLYILVAIVVEIQLVIQGKRTKQKNSYYLGFSLLNAFFLILPFLCLGYEYLDAVRKMNAGMEAGFWGLFHFQWVYYVAYVTWWSF